MNKRAAVLVSGLVILLAVVLAYSNHFYNDFHFDDSHTIQENGYIRELKNIPKFFQSVETSSSMPSHQGYRPVVTTTLAIDYALGLKKTDGKNGYDLFFFHLSNFTWFLLIILLLYFVQKDLYQRAFTNFKNIAFLALGGCFWYGMLTINAETVNYVISRSDILSTLAIVGSLTIYISFPHLRRYYLYVIPAAIGMLAKETTIMFAPLLVAYDFMIEKQMSLSQIFSGKGIAAFFKSFVVGLPALLIGLGLAYFGIKMTAVFDMSGTGSPWTYRLAQPYMVMHYIVQFFFPFGLSADTDLAGVISWADDRIYIGFAFLVFMVWAAFKASSKAEWRPAAYGIVWFLLTLLPTSIVPLAEVTNDHRVFLPNIGLIIVVLNIVGNLYYFTFSKKPALQYTLVAALLLVNCGYGYGVYQRNKVWKSEESLWQDVTIKSPGNGRGWMNYGLTLMRKGDYRGTEFAFRKAQERTPNYYMLQINIAILNEIEGRMDEAEKYYKYALASGSGYVDPYFYYARALHKMGAYAQAEVYCDTALMKYDGHLSSLYLQMDILKLQQKWPKLKQTAEHTLTLYPGDATAQAYFTMAQNPAQAAPVTAVTYLNQSLVLYNAKRYRECIDACFQALKLDPNYAEAYNNMCSAYNQLSKFDSAVWAGSKAVELKPDFQLAKNNLNWAKSQLK